MATMMEHPSRWSYDRRARFYDNGDPYPIHWFVCLGCGGQFPKCKGENIPEGFYCLAAKVDGCEGVRYYASEECINVAIEKLAQHTHASEITVYDRNGKPTIPGALEFVFGAR